MYIFYVYVFISLMGNMLIWKPGICMLNVVKKLMFLNGVSQVLIEYIKIWMVTF